MRRMAMLWVVALLGGCGASELQVSDEPLVLDELADAGAPLLAALEGPCASSTRFQLGAGIYDITGPAAELGMMGYAMVEQKTAGIHQRLWSRAFVFASPCNGKRAVFVSADLGQIFQGVKQQVVERLRARYGTLYGDANVLLSATHTHAGPGGHSHYAMYNLTVLGFDRQNFDAIVEGIYQSIVRAHHNLAEGRLQVASSDVADASVNRSAVAYAKNPAAERAQYAHDVDRRMTLLKLTAAGGAEIGAVNWFAVHGTSMGNDNRLISGDNKGYASYLFEKAKRADPWAARTFVAAFAQSNEGDVSPNIHGGEDGGGANDFESTSLSARKQLARAQGLYAAATELLVGGVDFRHVHLPFDALSVAPAFGGGVARTTCPAAIGLSMLAGAEDGRGFGREGWTCADARGLWTQLSCSVSTTACQGEKPIVVETGKLEPYPWSPEVLPVQVLKIGNLALVGVPFELTTMAGRRLRATVEQVLRPAGVKRVVIAGLANAYAGYVTTREEYAAQHYEGASTHFGPWTLGALQQQTQRLAVSLRDGTSLPPGPSPRDLRKEQSSVQTGVVFDDKPLGRSFGEVISQPRESYARGQTASVTFWGAHPKNNLRTMDSFLRIQRKTPGGSWVTVATDNDWETRYLWKRDACVPTLACSRVTVEWTIPASAAPGTYRIRHDGNWRSGWDGKIRPYAGTSRELTVK